MREMKGQAAERQILKLCCVNGSRSSRKVILPHKEVKTAGQQYKCKTFSFIKCPHPKRITIFSRFWVAFPFWMNSYPESFWIKSVKKPKENNVHCYAKVMKIRVLRKTILINSLYLEVAVTPLRFFLSNFLYVQCVWLALMLLSCKSESKCVLIIRKHFFQHDLYSSCQIQRCMQFKEEKAMYTIYSFYCCC